MAISYTFSSSSSFLVLLSWLFKRLLLGQHCSPVCSSSSQKLSGGNAVSIVVCFSLWQLSYFVFVSLLMRIQLSSREMYGSLASALKCTKALHQLEIVTCSWIIFAQRMVFLLTYFNILAHWEQEWVNRKQTVLLTQQSPLRFVHVHFFFLPLYIIPRGWYLALLRITKSGTNLQTQLLAECQLFLLIFFFF